ncbi:MAG: glycosyltransferase family 4 protein [Verrucomicrobia bacterium]|nr:glycosyltransferase family 4 protein [Verrucomicrobiota bacterium]
MSASMDDTAKNRVRAKWYGINWQISVTSGWGVLGLNLALQAEQDGRIAAVPLVKTINAESVPAEYKPWMEKILGRERVIRDLFGNDPNARLECDFPVLHSLGNRLASIDAADRIVGKSNLAIIFFEDTFFPPITKEIARRFDLILGGSTWNSDMLRRRGLQNVDTLIQGVDLGLFRPIRPKGTAQTPFFIFSGGKIEYRKGQDIVVAAFRKFRERHKEAVLFTAWHNHWPKSIEGIDHKGHVNGSPSVGEDGQLDITNWLEANGVPKSASYNLGVTPNSFMPAVYAQADVAVFTNRCEGGTNMAAMECLACGVPTILSNNTGHLDIIDEQHCYPLMDQGSVDLVYPYKGTDEWGESSVDEVVDALERVYRDRKEAEAKGEAGTRFMQDWTWRRRHLELVDFLKRFVDI